jgi:signal transduction histidine kinase
VERAPSTAAVAALPADSDCARTAADQSAERFPRPTLMGRGEPATSSVESGEESFLHTLEAAKLAALAEFAAGAGHEINNPLATIVGRVQALLRHETDPGRRQNLATIAAQAFRIRDMIGDLMVFARPPAPECERLVLNDALRAVVERFQDAARDQACSLTFEADVTVFATADPTQLNVVLSELVRNSLEAVAPQSGAIRASVTTATTEDRSYSVAIVADNGRGLSETDRAHLFDPFYSGRDAGRGLGFGLSKCWRIVNNHGGWIDVESAPGAGTTFRVFWPATPAPGGDPDAPLTPRSGG